MSASVLWTGPLGRWATDMNSSPEVELLDVRALLRWVRDDVRLLRQLTEMFRGYYPSLIEDARGAIALGDADGLSKAAQRLGRAVGLFQAGPTLELTRVLDRQGRTRQLSRSSQDMNRLELSILTMLGRLDSLTQATPRRSSRSSVTAFHQAHAVSADVVSAGSSTPSRKPASVRQR